MLRSCCGIRKKGFQWPGFPVPKEGKPDHNKTFHWRFQPENRSWLRENAKNRYVVRQVLLRQCNFGIRVQKTGGGRSAAAFALFVNHSSQATCRENPAETRPPANRPSSDMVLQTSTLFCSCNSKYALVFTEHSDKKQKKTIDTPCLKGYNQQVSLYRKSLKA